MAISLATSITVRTDPLMKKKYFDICEEMGMSASTGLSMFMAYVIREKSLPFEVKTEEADELRLERYVEKNKDLIEKGMKDFENGDYYTLKAGDLKSLNKLIDKIDNEVKNA